MIVVSLIFIVIGLTMIFNTKLFWKITESWKSGNSYNPSDVYQVSTKFGGIMFFLVGLGGVIAKLFFS